MRIIFLFCLITFSLSHPIVNATLVAEEIFPEGIEDSSRYYDNLYKAAATLRKQNGREPLFKSLRGFYKELHQQFQLWHNKPKILEQFLMAEAKTDVEVNFAAMDFDILQSLLLRNRARYKQVEKVISNFSNKKVPDTLQLIQWDMRFREGAIGGTLLAKLGIPPSFFKGGGTQSSAAHDFASKQSPPYNFQGTIAFDRLFESMTSNQKSSKIALVFEAMGHIKAPSFFDDPVNGRCEQLAGMMFLMSPPPEIYDLFLEKFQHNVRLYSLFFKYFEGHYQRAYDNKSHLKILKTKHLAPLLEKKEYPDLSLVLERLSQEFHWQKMMWRQRARDCCAAYHTHFTILNPIYEDPLTQAMLYFGPHQEIRTLGIFLRNQVKRYYGLEKCLGKERRALDELLSTDPQSSEDTSHLYALYDALVSYEKVVNQWQDFWRYRYHNKFEEKVKAPGGNPKSRLSDSGFSMVNFSTPKGYDDYWYASYEEDVSLSDRTLTPSTSCSSLGSFTDSPEKKPSIPLLNLGGKVQEIQQRLAYAKTPRSPIKYKGGNRSPDIDLARQGFGSVQGRVKAFDEKAEKAEEERQRTPTSSPKTSPTGGGGSTILMAGLRPVVSPKTSPKTHYDGSPRTEAEDDFIAQITPRSVRFQSEDSKRNRSTSLLSQSVLKPLVGTSPRRRHSLTSDFITHVSPRTGKSPERQNSVRFQSVDQPSTSMGAPSSTRPSAAVIPKLDLDKVTRTLSPRGGGDQNFIEQAGNLWTSRTSARAEEFTPRERRLEREKGKQSPGKSPRKSPRKLLKTMVRSVSSSGSRKD